ncbi:MAG: hypothetical protein WC700_16875 [Gemmatimonadaceae bacterium]
MNAFRAGIVDSASIRELEALQQELQRLLLEVDPQRGLRDTMTLAVGMLHRYAAGVVHVGVYPKGSGRVGGRLKNSLFWDVQTGGASVTGVMGTNVEYSIFEERRGGSHAFMDRTEREEGPAVERLFNVRISGGRAT